jgi:putative DNA primase/helicase
MPAPPRAGGKIMTTALDLRAIARAVGGEISGRQVLAPGPGHSPRDRSLSIKIEPTAPGGLLVHSFAGDDPIACRDYVRRKLGLPEFEPKKAKKVNGGAKPFSPTIAKYVYRQADKTPYLQVHRLANKSGFPQYHWDGEKWISGKPKGAKIPYMLPQLIAAPPATPIYIVEGEKDVDNLAKLGFVATCNSEGADNGNGNKWTPDLNQYFKDRDIYILPDNDEQGRKHAQHVARNLDPVAKSVRIVELPSLPPKGDVSNWLESDRAGVKLAKLAAAAPLWEPSAGKTGILSDERLVAELAGLSRLEYAKRRKSAAEAIGIGVAELDQIVAAARGDGKEKEPAGQPSHWAVEPAGEPVDGAALLDSMRAVFRRYIMLPPWADIALPLWTLHAWTHDACEISPIMCLTSPTKRCGKTSVMILLTYLTPRSELAANVSTASIFRYIEAEHPTLLIDEADSFLSENEEMRGILNSGHTKAGASVVRVVEEGGEHVTKRFSTWGPKAIALIKKLPDTLADRSVTVRLMRKSPTARVDRLRKRDSAEFRTLRSQAARWAADHGLKLIDAEPSVPDTLHDRAADNWRPLLAIADLAGGRWPELARKAACDLSGAEDDGALNVTLLGGVRTAFGDQDVMRSADLVAALTADPEGPWVEYNRGKPLTQRQLAKLLGQFGIVSEFVHPPGLPHGKGYRRAHFVALWEAYCLSSPGQNDPSDQISDSQGRKVAKCDETGTTRDFSRLQKDLLQGSKSANLSNIHAVLQPCNLKNGVEASKGDSDQGFEGNGASQHSPVCVHCGSPKPAPNRVAVDGLNVWLHPRCEAGYLGRLDDDGLDIPIFLRRRAS